MPKNVIRQVRNQVRAQKRAKERTLKSSDAYISTLYTEGQEIVTFWFNAFSLWMHDGAEEVFQFLKEQNLDTDDWNRGVFSLSKEQAITLGRLVEEWNEDWLPPYDEEGNSNYNAYHISFGPASGTEHQITVSTGGRYTTESWQR